MLRIADAACRSKRRRFAGRVIGRAVATVALFAIVLAVTAPADSRVVKVEIAARYAFAPDRSYGAAGAYEVLVGRLHYAVDPKHAANKPIIDIAHAPRAADGAVAFSGDFILMKPIDPGRGNGRLLLEVTNRGGLALLPFVNFASWSNRPETAGHGGDGLLLEAGFSLLWTGWNWDVTDGNGRLQITLPIAEVDGRPVTGRVVSELVPRWPTTVMPVAWGNSRGYAPAGVPEARLTVRPSQTAPRRQIPDNDWALLPGRSTADPYHLRLDAGFQPGQIYEISYQATGARVVGLGLAALRDAASFFKHATDSSNPLAGRIDRVIGFGISQSARVLQHMLWQGFHRDEDGRGVIDAVFAHVPGGGKGSFNHRFAQTTRHPSQHEDHQYPADFFPFATVPQSDPVTGQTADLLARARAAGPLPKIFYTQTSTDYWTRSASLLHTDVAGNRDLALDADARLYVFAGAQHAVGVAPSRGRFVLCRNPADYRFLLRALIGRLDDWLSGRRPPPASVYPTIADGSLGSLAAYRSRFPAVPGPNGPLAPPKKHLAPPRLDLGPRFATDGIIDSHPPRFGSVFETRLPLPDTDGIDRGGIRLPTLAAPLGTHLGWNHRTDGAIDAIGRWAGSYVPFAPDQATARQAGDPRRGLAERYGDRAGYLAAVEAAAQHLVRQGFLLNRDRPAILGRAARRFDRQTARPSDDGSCTYLR